MKEALFRLGIISLVSISGAAILLVALRTLGFTQIYSPVRHPLAERDFILIAKGGALGSAPSHTALAFDQALEIYPNSVLEATIQRTADGEWVLFEHQKLELQTDGAGRVGNHTLAELKNLNAGHYYQDPNSGQFQHRDLGLQLMTLDEFLDRYPEQEFVLNVEMRYPFMVSELIGKLSDRSLDGRVIIRSPYSHVLREIKKHYPRWLYKTDPATLFRASIMGSLYIESVSNIWTDIVLTTLGEGEGDISNRMLSEIKRRKKILILDEDKNFSALSDSLSDHIQGVATSRPDLALEYFADRLEDTGGPLSKEVD